MSMRKREIRRTLLRKFSFQEVPGSRHEAVAFYFGNEKIATTRFSRGSGSDIGDDLLAVMAKEVRVCQLRFFREMIDCTRSYDDYVGRLREGGYI